MQPEHNRNPVGRTADHNPELAKPPTAACPDRFHARLTADSQTEVNIRLDEIARWTDCRRV